MGLVAIVEHAAGAVRVTGVVDEVGHVPCPRGVHHGRLIQAEHVGSGPDHALVALALPLIGHRWAHAVPDVLDDEVALLVWDLTEEPDAVDAALTAREPVLGGRVHLLEPLRRRLDAAAGRRRRVLRRLRLDIPAVPTREHHCRLRWGQQALALPPRGDVGQRLHYTSFCHRRRDGVGLAQAAPQPEINGASARAPRPCGLLQLALPEVLQKRPGSPRILLRLPAETGGALRGLHGLCVSRAEGTQTDTRLGLAGTLNLHGLHAVLRRGPRTEGVVGDVALFRVALDARPVRCVTHLAREREAGLRNCTEVGDGLHS